jgi:hypothetical protein
MMYKVKLPIELLIEVVDHLTSPRDILSLLKANRLFYSSFSRHLYECDTKHHDSSALLWAAVHGELQTAKYSLDVGANGMMGPALQLAVKHRSWKVVELLVEKGANIDGRHEKNEYFGNALQAAAWTGNKQAVELLLDLGANVNMKGGHYNDALQQGFGSATARERRGRQFPRRLLRQCPPSSLMDWC